MVVSNPLRSWAYLLFHPSVVAEEEVTASPSNIAALGFP